MTLDLTLAVLTGSGLALVSGAHCAVMCGPLALASRVRNGPHASLSYFGGRLVSYTLAGALAGGAGQALLLSPFARWAEAGLSWALAATLLFTGVTMLRGRSAAQPLLSLGKKPRDSRAGHLLARVAGDPLLLGALTALLPCGALFSALVSAAALGSAAHGALAMATFAVLTGVVVVGLGQLGLLFKRGPVLKRVVAGALLIGSALMVYRPLPLLLAGESVPLCHQPLAGKGALR